MKIAVTADIHLANHREFSTILPDGTNSRLKIGSDALKFVTDDSKADVLVIAGDLFHDQESIDVSVLMETSKAISYASSHHQSVYILVGNHDQYLTNGNIHSLSQYVGHSNVFVIDQPHYDPFLNALFMPYIRDYSVWSEEFKKLVKQFPDASMAFLHADIIGASMNGGFLSSKGVPVEALMWSKIPIILSGHYHKPQCLYNLDGFQAHYVGSPYQLDRAESGEKKRYFSIDTSNFEVTSHPIVGFPEFKKVKDVAEAKKDGKNGHFVDLSCTPKEAEEIVKDGKKNVNLIVSKSVDQNLYIDHVHIEIPDALRNDLEKRGRLDLFDIALARLSSST